MANPLPNEHEIYEKITKQNIGIHPLIWQLIEHHIGNNLYIINLIIGSTVLDGQPLSKENAEKIINHTGATKDFLSKISKFIKPKSENV